MDVSPDERVEQLREVFGSASHVLVLSHDNPDPDALASGFALGAVLHDLVGVDATVGYAGIIGRAENRAMVRELDLSPVRLEEIDWNAIDAAALVDTQPGVGNNSLPEDRVAEAVIDHHPVRGRLNGVPFVDIREDYGATATIIFEYAVASGTHFEDNLATALFYAIKSETQELGRGAGDADRSAYLELLPRADKPALARIQRARVPRDYFRAFQLAIENARVHGRAVITDLERVESPDLVAEIADFLLRLEGADWAACLGRYDDAMVLSLRTTDPEAHAGEVIRTVVAGLGRAGGHGMMAGGRVPLRGAAYAELAEEVGGRLLKALGGDKRPGERLIVETELLNGS